MKVAVTGGKGFIGTHLVNALKERGFDVVVVDLPENDIRNTDRMKELFSDAEYVFHLAALVSVPKSIAEPQYAHDVNVTGMLSVLEAARLSAVKKVIFASSAAVYGSSGSPDSPYGLHKLMGEQYLTLYKSLFGLNFAALRFFNVYGPGQKAESQYSGVISRFLDAAKKNEPPTIFGDGTQTRDFVHVHDVVEALIKASAVDVPEPLNIGTGNETSVNQLAALISPLTPKYEPARVGDITRSVADITRTKMLLDWEPTISIKNGIAELK